MQSTPKPKVYSYLRFSSPEQRKGDSKRRQLDYAVVYAARQGLELDKTLHFADEGQSAYTGANVRKGALGQFLRLVDDGEIAPGSILLIESLDRMSRMDPWDVLPVFQQIINSGITVVTLKDDKVWTREKMRESPMRIIESILYMMEAHKSSDDKSKRLREVWQTKRKNAGSKRVTSVCPAWLRLDPAANAFVPLPERAAVVQRIYADALAGHGAQRIARALNSEGVPPFGKTPWSYTYVRSILTNPAVVGTFIPNIVRRGVVREREPQRDAAVHGYFPAVIDTETFETAQVMLEASRTQHVQRIQRRDRGGDNPNLFAGLLRCSLCGGPVARKMSGGGKRGQRERTPIAYLVCKAAKEGRGCPHRAARYDQVVEALRVHGPAMLADAPAGSGAEIDAEIESLRTADLEMGEQIGNLLSAIRRGLDTPAVEADLRHLENERAMGRVRLEELETIRTEAFGPFVARRIENLMSHLTAEPMEAGQVSAGLRQVFRSLVLDLDAGTIECEWRHGGSSSLLVFWPGDSNDGSERAA